MIKALIFDLCDTVVRTAGLPGLAHLPGVEGRHDAQSLERWLLDSAEFPAFERGEIGAAAFLAVAQAAGVRLPFKPAELRRATESKRFDPAPMQRRLGVTPRSFEDGVREKLARERSSQEGSVIDG